MQNLNVEIKMKKNRKDEEIILIDKKTNKTSNLHLNKENNIFSNSKMIQIKNKKNNDSKSIVNIQKFNNLPSPLVALRIMKGNQIIPDIQNVVSTVNLGIQLDLKRIALKTRNAEYNPRRFAAVVMRIRDPKTTALIFSSGKMVITGAKSEETAKLGGKKYARIIQKNRIRPHKVFRF
mmetsp:Transcript_33131/g.81331  ORF Transcript_33131/g.81331 Transcript_33131/m.81331 type:complete len:178 (+) Transcript_33131:3221-3754(+)